MLTLVQIRWHTNWSEQTLHLLAGPLSIVSCNATIWFNRGDGRKRNGNCQMITHGLV